jgi:hypothetical protein
MIDLATVLGEAAAVVDPKGENEDVSVLCGLVAWAVEHPDDTVGGTRRPFRSASVELRRRRHGGRRDGRAARRRERVRGSRWRAPIEPINFQQGWVDRAS